MIDRKYQKYSVTITFDFEAEVFEEDPSDVFELAGLEKENINYNIGALSSFAESPTNVDVDVKPIL